MGLFRAQNLSRCLVFIVNNVQRPHVFCYFRGDTQSTSSNAGTIAGAVVGSLIVLGLMIALIIHCLKNPNAVHVIRTECDVNTTQVSSQQQQQTGIIYYYLLSLILV